MTIQPHSLTFQLFLLKSRRHHPGWRPLHKWLAADSHAPEHPHPRIKYGAGSNPLPSRERGPDPLPGFSWRHFAKVSGWAYGGHGAPAGDLCISGWPPILTPRITLTPVSSTGQALTLSHQGRGDRTRCPIKDRGDRTPLSHQGTRARWSTARANRRSLDSRSPPADRGDRTRFPASLGGILQRSPGGRMAAMVRPLETFA